MEKVSQKALESRMRRRAAAKGYALEKSRDRSLHSDNKGGYRLVRDNTVVDGDRFSLMLNELDEAITRLPDWR
jgi:hypothetical protein